MPDPKLALLVAALAAGLVALVAWPDTGLYARWRRARRSDRRVMTEDALKRIFEIGLAGRGATRQDLAASLQRPGREIEVLVADMAAGGLLESETEPLALTPAGHSQALHILRAHRLWERYLADETGFGATEWHRRAHEREHELSAAELDALAARLSHPTHDPHGDPIPGADGRMLAPAWPDLTELEVGQVARIVHLEDEPAAVYAQLVAEGLAPGMTVRVLERDPQRIRFWSDGDEHLLAPLLASNVSVAPIPADAPAPGEVPSSRLSGLRPGQRAVVSGIAPACQGSERRRFLDLGILPGTRVEAALASPSGNPVAYRIRGALIALRDDQADFIQVRDIEEVPA